jgi:hypothetical protein
MGTPLRERAGRPTYAPWDAWMIPSHVASIPSA